MLIMAKERKPRSGNPWPVRLRKLQGERSNQEMADLLGVSLHTYTAWLYGTRAPRIPSQRLIEALLKSEK